MDINLGRLRRKQKEKALKEQRKVGYGGPEFESFFSALQGLYRHVLQNGYSAVIIPLRGAEPFMKAVQLFASLERKSGRLPRVYYLKIGERVNEGRAGVPKYNLPDSFGEFLPAYPIPAQRETIKNTLAKIAVHSDKRDLKVLLIDEVINGGSVLKQRRLINEAAKELGLNVRLKTAVISEMGHAKKQAFQDLVKRGEIKVFGVKKIISSDNFKFLVQQVQTKEGEKLRVSKASFEHRMNLLAKLQKRFQRRA